MAVMSPPGSRNRTTASPMDQPPASSAAHSDSARPAAPTDSPAVSIVNPVWDEADSSPDELGVRLGKAGNDRIELTMITNRGLKVWPKGAPETFCTDHWRCRFEGASDSVAVQPQDILDAQQRVLDHGFDIIKTENLYTFDGVPGYSLGQGQ